MLQRLSGGHAVTIIVDEQFGYDLLGIRGHVRYEFGDSGAFLVPEVELHVRGHALKFRQKLRAWRAQDVMNFVDLVELVIAGEKRE